MASICRFANENLIASFITGFQHTFLTDKWLKISADFFVSRLVVYWGEKIVIFACCFWTNQCIVRSLCFSELIFLLTLWYLPRTRVKWDACHVHCHKIWLLSSSQLCPSSVNTRSCPAFRVFNSKESALTVVLRIYSDHIRLLIT